MSSLVVAFYQTNKWNSYYIKFNKIDIISIQQMNENLNFINVKSFCNRCYVIGFDKAL